MVVQKITARIIHKSISISRSNTEHKFTVYDSKAKMYCFSHSFFKNFLKSNSTRKRDSNKIYYEIRKDKSYIILYTSHILPK